MGLRINTNLASIGVQRQLYSSQGKLEKAMKALASGSRLNDASQGSADFAIAEHLKGQITGMKAARTNADNAVSFVQVAEGGLNEQNNVLIRMRELAVQSASDTFSDVEREMMDMEYQQLAEEFDRIAKTTSFGSQQLLKGEEKDYEFQVGAYKGSENIVKYKSNTNTTISAIGLDGYNVLDKDEARSSLETIDEALTKIAQARASFGAIQSRLESVSSNASNQIVSLEEARSRIADTDIAQAVSEVRKQQALIQYQVAALNEANQLPASMLRLIA